MASYGEVEPSASAADIAAAAMDGLAPSAQPASGRWTALEHGAFVEGCRRFGKDWKLIADLVPTRTVVQVRTHAQKFFAKLDKCCELMPTMENRPPGQRCVSVEEARRLVLAEQAALRAHIVTPQLAILGHIPVCNLEELSSCLGEGGSGGHAAEWSAAAADDGVRGKGLAAMPPGATRTPNTFVVSATDPTSIDAIDDGEHGDVESASSGPGTGRVAAAAAAAAAGAAAAGEAEESSKRVRRAHDAGDDAAYGRSLGFRAHCTALDVSQATLGPAVPPSTGSTHGSSVSTASLRSSAAEGPASEVSGAATLSPTSESCSAPVEDATHAAPGLAASAPVAHSGPVCAPSVQIGSLSVNVDLANARGVVPETRVGAQTASLLCASRPASFHVAVPASGSATARPHENPRRTRSLPASAMMSQQLAVSPGGILYALAASAPKESSPVLRALAGGRPLVGQDTAEDEEAEALSLRAGHHEYSHPDVHHGNHGAVPGLPRLALPASSGAARRALPMGAGPGLFAGALSPQEEYPANRVLPWAEGTRKRARDTRKGWTMFA